MKDWRLKFQQARLEQLLPEAINHYAPGAGILSCGNIGCMMSCSYCHNWRTSQAKHVVHSDIFEMSPQDAVQIALRRTLPVISFTYNDPVVWHEWVVDTARAAREAGIVTLYKSAFYITSEAIEQLIPHVDIFSISLKSMDPHYYKKYTAGRLEPVLEGIKQVHNSGRHLELSTFMITDISDNEETACRVTEWVLRDLGPTVPMHFVRFHPDFRMRDTIRTPIPRLERAREVATSMGVEHDYLGTVYDTPYCNTYCRGCDAELVTRYGLNAKIKGLDRNGRCTACGKDAHFKFLRSSHPNGARRPAADVAGQKHAVDWHGDVRSLHVQLSNPSPDNLNAWYRYRFSNGTAGGWKAVARADLARFNADIPFDDVGFILREECAFRYRKLPASLDRRHRQFCTERLRIEKGDVFMVVGTVLPERLLPFVERERNLFDVSGALIAPVLAPAERVPVPEVRP